MRPSDAFSRPEPPPEGWQPGPGGSESAVLWLSGDEAHVWRVDLATAADLAERFGGALTPDERERAARFRDVGHRTRFVGVRGWLRALLAEYLGQSPFDLRFRYGSHGKPTLASANPLDLRFNLSHSAEAALVALTRGREVGVDVELRRGRKLRLAERFFAADEVARLRALPADEQEHAFYRCWTRKEAFVKARGEGLSLALHCFAVAIDPSEPPAILRVDGEAREAERWSVRDLPEISGYAAALVVEGPIRSLRCWQWRARTAGQS